MIKMYDTLIEITFAVSDLLNSGKISLSGIADPYAGSAYEEIKNLIVDMAERFEKIHRETDWLEMDYREELYKFVEKEVALYLWNCFTCVPVYSNTEEIGRAWNTFPAGTHCETIEHWFEETFHVSVVEELMEAVS